MSVNNFIKCFVLVFYMMLCVAPSHANDDIERVLDKIQQRYHFAHKLKVFNIDYKSQSKFGPQSYRHDQPEYLYRQQITDIDLDKKWYFSRMIRGPFPGNFIFDTSEYQNATEQYRYDNNYVLYGKRVREIPSTAFQGEIDELEVVVDSLAVAKLLNTPDLASKLSIAKSENEEHLVLQLSVPKGPPVVYTFAKKSLDLLKLKNKGKLQAAEFSQVLASDSLPYARQITVTNRGNPREYRINSLQMIDAIPPNKLRIPKGYGPVLSAKRLPITSSEIAPDLHLLSNVAFDRHVLVQVKGSELAVFGAPGRKPTEQVAAYLKEKFPNKKVTSVYVTHHHNDHIAGLPVYVELGATVVADPYTIEAIRDFLPFRGSIEKFKFKAVSNGTQLDGVTYYLPPNTHAIGQSFVYFNDSKIIYEGDLLEIPYDNTIPTHMSDVDREFIEFIYKQKLDINRIVGHHRNGNITKDIVDAYYRHHHG